MFVAMTCPKCKSKQMAETHGMIAGQRMRCIKCRHYFPFTAPSEPVPEEKKAAVGEFLGDVAVLQIGLVAFIDRIRGVAPGWSIVLGFFAFVGLSFYVVGLFAPEGPKMTGGVEQHAPPAIALAAEQKKAEDKEAQQAAADPLAFHLARLKDKDAAVRARSVRALGGLGSGAEPALGDLLRVANDSNPDILSAVDDALNGIGAPGKENWVWVTRALSHKAKPPRAWALRVLATPEHAEIDELPRVIDSLNHPDKDLHLLAAKVLDNFQTKDRDTVVSRLFKEKALPAKLYVTQSLAEPGKVFLADLPGLVSCLNDRHLELRTSAARALDNFPVAERKDVLLTLAKDKGPPAQLYVANFLAKSDSMVVPEAVPNLLEWLSAPDRDLQKQSAAALANFGPEHFDKLREQPKVLAQALTNKAKPARAWALKLLARPENAELSELPRVIDCLGDSDKDVSQLAARTLDNFQVKDRDVVIKRLLSDKTLPAKLYVTEQLAEPGRATLDELPMLAQYLSDANQKLRDQTAKVLDGYPEADRKKVLLTLAQERYAPPKMYVARCLARPDAKVIPEAMPSLLEWLSGTNRELQQQSALALAQFGPEHADKIRMPLLRLAPKYDDAKTAPTLFEKIKALGAAPRADLEEIKALVENPRPEVRILAWELLAGMDLNKTEIVTMFPPLIKETEPQLRIVALSQIARLGKEGTPYVADLKTLVDDKNLPVRRKAYESLVALAPQEGLTTLFLRAAQETDAGIVRQAGLGLSRMPALGKEQLPTLLGFLKHAEPSLRVAAARNFAVLGDQGAAALDQLVKALGDAEPAVRIHATRALVGLGKEVPGLAGFSMRVDHDAPGDIANDDHLNAAPTLVRFGNHYYAAWVRARVSKEVPAKVMIVRSSAQDLKKWEAAAHFDMTENSAVSSEEPQLLLAGKRLHLYWHDKGNQVSTSTDGLKWSDARAVAVEFPRTIAKVDSLSPRQRLARIRKGPDRAFYGMVRCLSTAGPSHLLLARSTDGLHFEVQHGPGEGIDELLGKLGRDGLEADLAFLETGGMVAAIRTGKAGIIAFSDEPYLKWQGVDSGIKDFAGPSLWKGKHGMLLSCRTLTKDGASCSVFTVTPTALIRSFAVKCGSENGYSCLESGLSDDEPVLVYCAARADAANICMMRLKIQANRISLLAD